MITPADMLIGAIVAALGVTWVFETCGFICDRWCEMIAAWIAILDYATSCWLFYLSLAVLSFVLSLRRFM